MARGGDLKRGEALFAEGLGALPSDAIFATERAFCLLRGSEMAYFAGDGEQALARAAEARQLADKSLIHSAYVELDTMLVVAGAYDDAGQRARSDSAFQQTIARLAELGWDQTQLADVAYNNWGTMLMRAGLPLDAERAFRNSIAINRTDQDDDSRASEMANYSEALYDLGRLDEAVHFAEQAYKKAVTNGDGQAARKSLLQLARCYRGQGKLARAGEALSELERRMRQNMPPQHIYFAMLASEAALVAHAAGDTLKAKQLADKAVGISAIAQAVAYRTVYQGRFLVNRSVIKLASGLTDDALADAAHAIPLLQQAAIPERFSADVGHAYLAQGRALLAEGKTSEAKAAFRSAAEHLEKTLGPDHLDSRAARQFAGR